MATPHNRGEKGDFARTVLMPGDPLRAKFIAMHFLENPRLVTDVRNMLGFTGTYGGKEISVMGAGMGMPSMGIYCHELFSFYDVDQIIRVGTAGSISQDCKVRDIVLAEGACTNSAFASQYRLKGTFAPTADFGLLNAAYTAAGKSGLPVKVGNVLSSDTFYCDDPDANDGWIRMGVLCIEMESAALYMEAARLHKKALSILTISDEILTGRELSSDQRERSFTDMMELALSIA